MQTTVHEILKTLERLAPPVLAEDWDNVGLLVAAREGVAQPVFRILTALDITPEVAAEAKAKGCELIVSHHPVIFSPLKCLSGEDVAFALVQNNISAICMHTNLDAAEGGVNDVLADIFEMTEREAFANGCGRVGAIAPLFAGELAEKAQSLLHTAVKFADAGRPIRRLAVISGAGGSMWQDALAVRADALLTGEANHHAACDAVRLGMSLVAATHYATEAPVVAALAKALAAEHPAVSVLCAETGKDPYEYLA